MNLEEEKGKGGACAYLLFFISVVVWQSDNWVITFRHLLFYVDITRSGSHNIEGLWNWNGWMNLTIDVEQVSRESGYLGCFPTL